MRNPYIKIALFLLVAGGLVFFVRATDWQAVLAAVRQVGYNFLFLLGITFLSAWLGVWGWQYCLPDKGAAVPAWKLFWIRMFGENIAILNPASMVGGEAAKIYLLRDLGVEPRTALHSIILSRTIMIVSQICLLLLAIVVFLILSGFSISRPAWSGFWSGGTLLLVLGGLWLLRSRVFRRGARAFLGRFGWLERYRQARQYLSNLWQELRTFYRDNRRAMFLSFLFCSLHWVVGSLEFYFILLFLGVKTTVAKALLVDMGVVVFKSAGAFVPAQIGVEEYGNKVMLALIGVAGSTIWVTASILRRTRQLCWMVMGFAVYAVLFRRRLVNFQP